MVTGTGLANQVDTENTAAPGPTALADTAAPVTKADRAVPAARAGTAGTAQMMDTAMVIPTHTATALPPPSPSICAR